MNEELKKLDGVVAPCRLKSRSNPLLRSKSTKNGLCDDCGAQSNKQTIFYDWPRCVLNMYIKKTTSLGAG